MSSRPQKSKSSRKVPWVAFGGLTLVALLALLALGLSITLIISTLPLQASPPRSHSAQHTSPICSLSSVKALFLELLHPTHKSPCTGLPFKAFGALLSTFIWWPLKFLLSLLLPIGYSSSYSPALANKLQCNNSIELQGWEVLSIFPDSDGNPKPIKYELNSPTPHAVSFIDIDYRDTRLDVFANGDYYGSMSDFVLDKGLFCGEDLNECIQKGFSTGTVVIPAGKKSVEIAWSGKGLFLAFPSFVLHWLMDKKDVFPGTDKIVWGADRKRRVMWKKELCL